MEIEQKAEEVAELIEYVPVEMAEAIIGEFILEK